MNKKKQEIKEGKLFAKLEKNALDLCIQGQMTTHLFRLIREAILKRDTEKLKLLKDLSEDTLRVRGYYHRHKEEEHNSNLYIDNKVAEFEKGRRKNE